MNEEIKQAKSMLNESFELLILKATAIVRFGQCYCGLVYDYIIKMKSPKMLSMSAGYMEKLLINGPHVAEAGPVIDAEGKKICIFAYYGKYRPIDNVYLARLIIKNMEDNSTCCRIF